MDSWNFYTFLTVDNKLLHGYIKANNKVEAIAKALERWPNADPKSCRIYRGVL